jgi:hypothetical protein
MIRAFCSNAGVGCELRIENGEGQDCSTMWGTTHYDALLILTKIIYIRIDL